MDIEDYRKHVEESLEVERFRREANKKIQEYDDQRQDLRIERAEIFQPITTHVDEVKKTIDERQDKLLEQLTENQNALATAVINFAPTPVSQTQAHALPSPAFTPPQFTKTLGQPSPLLYNADIDKNFTPNEIQRLMDYQLRAPSQVMKAVMDKLLDWKEYDISLGKQLQNLGRKKGQLSKSKKAKEENALAIEDLTSDIKLLQKYRTRIKMLDEGQPLLSPTFTGKGAPVKSSSRKYKQPKRNAYKINSVSGQYGGLIINKSRLKNEMVVEAAKGGKIIYEQPADKSLVDLLTKKYRSALNTYSPKAKQIFQDLNKLANMPKHRSSGKSKLLNERLAPRPLKGKPLKGGQIYYTSPEDLMKRLTLLTGSRVAGNTSLEQRNEISEILDHLLKNEKITKKQYDDYIQKHIQ